MSERELVYRVSIAGQAEFARDLRGLHDMQRRMVTEELALATAASRGKRKIRDDEARHQAALMRSQLALEKARYRELQRDAARIERDHKRAESEKTRTTQREERARQRAAASEQKATIRAKLEETRAFERAEREKTRIAAREAKARQREEESVQRAVMRAQEASMRFQMREREKLQRKADRDAYVANRDELFNRKRLFRSIGTGAAAGAYGAISGGVGMAMGVARSIGQATGAFSAFDIGDIVAERFQAKALMRSAAIEAREAGNPFGSGFDEVAGYAKVRSTALRWGMNQRDLLGAIDAASEKGSGADAVNNLDRIAMQANAMGTDATTVARMRAQIKMSWKESGKAPDDKVIDSKIDEMMAQMHFMGKTGVFRAEDLAKESESLVSSFVKGGGDLGRDWKRYMAFANEARKSVGSGAMARTSILGIQDSIAKRESKINALGIKTRNKDGSDRSFMDVALDVIEKTGAEGKTFTAIFDPSKAGKSIATLVTRFKAAGKGKAGRAAMEEVLAGDESLKDATVAEMQKDADLRMEDQGVRIRKAVETIRQAFADKLEPILNEFAKKAPEWAESLRKALSWVIEHPKTAALGAVAGNALLNGGKPLAFHAGAGALRYLGDRAAQSTMGGSVAGKMLGSLGGLASQLTAQPVYVTGVAPGVSLGGGFPGVGGGGGGGVGGLGSIGGAVGGAGIMGTLGGVAALTVATTAVTVGLWELYKSTDAYKDKLDQTVEKHLKDNRDLEEALANKVTPDKIQKTIEGIVFQPGSKRHGDEAGGEGVLVQSRAADAFVGANKAVALKMVDEALGGNSTKHHGTVPMTEQGEKLLNALGVKATGGATLVGPAAEGTKAIAAATEAERLAKAMEQASKAADDLSLKLNRVNANTSAIKGPITRGGG